MGLWQKLAASGVGAVVIAAAIAGTFEGVRHHAYSDVGGVPTICYGHTHGVSPGMTATQAQCNAWLMRDIRVADATISRCYPEPPTRGIRAALDDLAFNEGPGHAGGKSGVCVLKNGRMPTIRKRALSGDWQGVCSEILKWDKAEGRVLPGLVKRRRAEYELCTQEASQ